MLLPCSLGASFLTMLPAPSDGGGAVADWIVLLPCMYLDQIVHDQPLPAALRSIVLPLRNNLGGCAARDLLRPASSAVVTAGWDCITGKHRQHVPFQTLDDGTLPRKLTTKMRTERWDAYFVVPQHASMSAARGCHAKRRSAALHRAARILDWGRGQPDVRMRHRAGPKSPIAHPLLYHQRCPTRSHHWHLCMRCSATSGPVRKVDLLKRFVGPMTTSNERIHPDGPGRSWLGWNPVRLTERRVVIWEPEKGRQASSTLLGGYWIMH